MTRRLLRSFGAKQRDIRITLGAIGLVITLVMLAAMTSLIGVGVLRSTAAIKLYGQDTYFDLRPLRFTINDLHYACTASHAWFADRRIQ